MFAKSISNEAHEKFQVTIQVMINAPLYQSKLVTFQQKKNFFLIWGASDIGSPYSALPNII